MVEDDPRSGAKLKHSEPDPGHYVEPSSRSDIREYEREFAAFNDRFRKAANWIPSSLRTHNPVDLELGKLVRQAEDADLYFCKLRGQSAVGRVYKNSVRTRQLRNEVSVAVAVHHPNIATFLGLTWVSDPNGIDSPVTLYQYFAEGSVYDANVRHNRLASLSPSSVCTTLSMSDGSPLKSKGRSEVRAYAPLTPTGCPISRPTPCGRNRRYSWWRGHVMWPPRWLTSTPTAPPASSIATSRRPIACCPRVVPALSSPTSTTRAISDVT